MNTNYTMKSWGSLWCACGGNKSGVHPEDILSNVHESVWIQGLIYVAVVMFLYALGFCFIVLHSGRNFKSSSEGFFNLHLGYSERYRRNRDLRQREKLEMKQTKKEIRKDFDLNKLNNEVKVEEESKRETKSNNKEEKIVKPLSPRIRVTVESSQAEKPPCSKTSTSTLLSYI
ncbi:UNVERIFIED_CONTAM: hypothetical protein RMT77_017013 [Armadillidium vulgare]